MKTVTIKITAHTDESGDLCYPTCPMWVGDWCDAFQIKLERHTCSSKYMRCDKCKESEVKE